MKIAIVGAGAIGGFLGARLAANGVDVTFVARGANLEAIRSNGMRLIEEDGTEKHLPGVRAAPINEAGAHDYVILTMKSHQVAPVAQDVSLLCHASTAVVTMQNGLPWWYFYRSGAAYENTRLQSVDPGGHLWDLLQPERAIGSVVYPAAELIAPGVVRVIEGNRFTLGEPSGEKSPRLLALAQAMIAAGFKAPITADIRGEIWVKLWGNVVFNPVSALTHSTLEEIARFPGTRDLARRMMSEAQAIAEKLGVHFKISIDKRIEGAEKVGAHKTSMLQDVEQGKAIELEAIVGSVVELARITQVPAPAIEGVYALAALLAQRLAATGGRLKLG